MINPKTRGLFPVLSMLRHQNYTPEVESPGLRQGAADPLSRFLRTARTLGAVLALLLIFIIGVASYRAVRQFEDRADWVEHTHEMQLEIAALQAMYSRLRVEWRTYLSTGTDASLAGFERGAAALPRQIEKLKALTADDLQQQERLAAIAALLSPNIAGMASANARKRSGDLSRPEDVESEFSAGRNSVLSVAAIAGDMQQVERELLAARKVEAAAAAVQTKYVIVAGSAASFALLALVLWMLTSEIRQRRDAQRAAQKAAAESEDLFDNAPCGYHSVDADGKIERINRTWLDWLGYSRDEVLGKSHAELMTPASAADFHGKWFPLFKQQGWLKEVEFDYVRKDGSTFPGSLQATAIHDAAGRYVTSRTVVFDISARKAADERIRGLNTQLQEHAAQLEASNKELESFSYSVSHDLRSPLRAIDGFSHMLQEDYADKLDLEARRLLDVIRDNSRNMGQLIDDLLEFSRLGRKVLSIARMDMKRLVERVLEDLHRLDNTGSPRVVLGALPPAYGDATLVMQVWMNLLSNAIKFSSRCEQPVIEVSGYEIGMECIYCVKDNGAGFDMNYYDKLFGVFQRLHSMGEFAGTGVGLAIVQRVITRHGGRVWAEGKVDEGAVFNFSLPKGKSNGSVRES